MTSSRMPGMPPQNALDSTFCPVKTDANGRELSDHGTALLPAAYYDIVPFDKPVAWHWHDDIEIGFTLESTIILCAGSSEAHLEKGDGFFIKPGVLHGVNAQNAQAHMRSIVFHPRLIGGSLESVYWSKYILPITQSVGFECLTFSSSEDWGNHLVTCIESAWESLRTQPNGYEFALRALLSDVILSVSEHRAAPEVAPSEKQMRDHERVKTMLAFIHTNFAEHLSIDDIARSAAVSKSECLRCFRSILNVTPIQYLRSYRLQKAADMLENSRLNITGIGVACGFTGMSYFARAFKEEYGQSPIEYRHAHVPGVARSNA